MMELDFSFEDDGFWNIEGSGKCSATLFGNALQVWGVFQERTVTIEEASLAFNTSPDNIKAAIEQHPFMVRSGRRIDFEGE